MYRKRHLKDKNQWELYYLSPPGEQEQQGAGHELSDAETIFPSAGSESQCLVCASCAVCIADSAHLLLDVARHLPDAVFSYDLEVLGSTVQCFSATNPAEDRFDVIRLSRDVDFVVSASEYSSDHSWFPGFLWTPCGCQGCGEFLGWKFRPDTSDGSSDAASSEGFFGLIVTKLRPRTLAGLVARRVFTSPSSH